MLPMWISPEGEIPLETTTGRPDAIAASAASSAQCREAVAPIVIVCFSPRPQSAARYIGDLASIKRRGSVLSNDHAL
jgi:hypothetical protein